MLYEFRSGMTGEKNRKSLFALSNSAFVESLRSTETALHGKVIPTKVKFVEP